MKPLAAALCLLRKDLRIHFRDKNGMLLGLLLPVALVLVFGYVMQFAFGGGGSMPKVALWLVDDDHSQASRRLVEALGGVDMLSLHPRADEAPLDAGALRQKVADGEVHHALLVGRGFGAEIDAGGAPRLTVVRDPGRTMEARIVDIGLLQAYLTANGGRTWPTLVERMLRGNGVAEGDLGRVLSAAQTTQATIENVLGARPGIGDAATAPAPDSKPAGVDLAQVLAQCAPIAHEDVTPPARAKNLSYQIAQSVAGMAVMMLMFGLMACSSTLLAERDAGTLRRLFVAAIDRRAILIGKYLLCVVVGLVQLVIVFTVAELAFHVDTFRDLPTLAVLALSWTACATSFGMLVAAWAKTQKQAEGLSTLLILVMAALGGCWFPVQIAELPRVAELVTRAMPTYWAMTGFQGMFWSQRSFLERPMLLAIGVQWVLAIVGGVVALRLFAHRYRGG
ncbi:MAG: ABC transporter permease [Planctomycetota bacterium]